MSKIQFTSTGAEYSSRCFDVTGGLVPVTCLVNYTGHGDAYKGGTIDGQVIPLILAAPALRDALADLVEWGVNHTSPRDPNSPHDLLVAAVEALKQAAPRGGAQ